MELNTLFPPEPPADQPIMENPTEAFLRLLRQQAMARAAEGGKQSIHTAMECDLHPLVPDMAEAGQQLARALSRIVEPLRTLSERLQARLEEDADTLDTTTRGRIEAMTRALRRRAISRLDAWITMLAALDQPPEPGSTPAHIHFIRLERRDKQRMNEQDVGLYRHWLDPTIPFAGIMAMPAQGMLMTSATLRDQQGGGTESDEAETAWEAAEARTGANHFPSPALRASLASPFDYARQTRAFIVTDVDNSSLVDLSAAFRTFSSPLAAAGLACLPPSPACAVCMTA